MPIYSILQNCAFEPKHIEPIAKAFEDALRDLRIKDRNSPSAHELAKAIFQVAQRGERDPERLQRAATELIMRSSIDLKAGVGGPRESEVNERPTVLIVEDDEAFAYAAARYLESKGYNSVVALGSLAAFRELDRQSVDVVIADVILGNNEPHGVSLGRMIRNRDQRMPVVLITAYPDMLEREKPLPGPVLAKPVDLAKLSELVETLRQSSRAGI